MLCFLFRWSKQPLDVLNNQVLYLAHRFTFYRFKIILVSHLYIDSAFWGQDKILDGLLLVARESDLIY